jgi:hypothetical protein
MLRLRSTARGVRVLLALKIPQASIVENADVFALPYLQDNLYLIMVMSGIFATLRVLGVVGLLRNRLWGLGLSIADCIVTLALMACLLPAGFQGFASGMEPKCGQAAIRAKRNPPTPQ